MERNTMKSTSQENEFLKKKSDNDDFEKKLCELSLEKIKSLCRSLDSNEKFEVIDEKVIIRKKAIKKIKK